MSDNNDARFFHVQHCGWKRPRGIVPPVHLPNALFHRHKNKMHCNVQTRPGPWSIKRDTKVCGNPGTLSFSSPEYQAYEDPYDYGEYDGHYSVNNGTVRITVVRTGGGYGNVGVKYQLRHGTTDEADVTSHAHYTTRCAADIDSDGVEMATPIQPSLGHRRPAQYRKKFDHDNL